MVCGSNFNGKVEAPSTASSAKPDLKLGWNRIRYGEFVAFWPKIESLLKLPKEICPQVDHEQHGTSKLPGLTAKVASLILKPEFQVIWPVFEALQF